MHSLSGDAKIAALSHMKKKKLSRLNQPIRGNTYLKTLFSFFFFFATSKIFSRQFVKHFNYNRKQLFTSLHQNDNTTKKISTAIKKKKEKPIQPYFFHYFCVLLIFLHM